ncbi:hypothetical protein WJX84_010279 [Apatococcus fuscideae]|uniref:Uncharacterized protein n=1 Tax=Apatococcus fuscideae TaxID=2026836 RepID=A0AAW1T675_9CHLO
MLQGNLQISRCWICWPAFIRDQQMLQLEESWTWGLYLGLAEAQACLQLVPAAVTDIRLSSRGELVDDLAWARPTAMQSLARVQYAQRMLEGGGVPPAAHLQLVFLRDVS